MAEYQVQSDDEYEEIEEDPEVQEFIARHEATGVPPLRIFTSFQNNSGHDGEEERNANLPKLQAETPVDDEQIGSGQKSAKELAEADVLASTSKRGIDALLQASVQRMAEASYQVNEEKKLEQLGFIIQRDTLPELTNYDYPVTTEPPRVCHNELAMRVKKVVDVPPQHFVEQTQPRNHPQNHNPAKAPSAETPVLESRADVEDSEANTTGGLVMKRLMKHRNLKRRPPSEGRIDSEQVLDEQQPCTSAVGEPIEDDKTREDVKLYKEVMAVLPSSEGRFVNKISRIEHFAATDDGLDRGFRAVVRSNVDKEQWTQWLREFSENTRTTWVVRRTDPRARTYYFSKVYFCHRSDSHHRTSGNRKTYKKIGCTARLSVKVEKDSAWRRRDDYFREGLAAKITVDFNHNHLIDDAESLSYLKPQPYIRHTFEDYFHEFGMNASSAKKHHEEQLALCDEFRPDWLLDGSRNPRLRTVYNWWVQWSKRIAEEGTLWRHRSRNDGASLDTVQLYGADGYANADDVYSYDAGHEMGVIQEQLIADKLAQEQRAAEERRVAAVRFDWSQPHFPIRHNQQQALVCRQHMEEDREGHTTGNDDRAVLTEWLCKACQVPLCPDCMERWHSAVVQYYIPVPEQDVTFDDNNQLLLQPSATQQHFHNSDHEQQIFYVQ